MPKLRSFTAAVREFLRAEEEYQWYRASINAEPVRLRSMISSKIMYALPRIVRSQGLAWNSKWDLTEDVPEDDEHRSVSPTPQAPRDSRSSAARLEGHQRVWLSEVQQAVRETLDGMPGVPAAAVTSERVEVAPEMLELLSRLGQELEAGQGQLGELSKKVDALTAKFSAAKGAVAVSDVKSTRATLEAATAEYETARREYATMRAEVKAKETMRNEIEVVVRAATIRKEVQMELSGSGMKAESTATRTSTTSVIPMIFPFMPPADNAEVDDMNHHVPDRGAM